MAKTRIDGKALKAMFGAGVKGLSDNVALINELNVFPVPDGDTGINLYHTLRRAWQEIATIDEDAVCVVAERFAYGALMGARGNSGTIMSQLLTGFADGLAEAPVLTAPLLIDACQSAVARAYAAVSEPVEGTILTVAREARDSLSAEMSLDGMLASLVDAARTSLNNTPNLLRLLKDAGVVDAGGMGLLCFLQGIERQHCTDSPDIHLSAVSEIKRPLLPSPAAEVYGYDVQFLMMGELMDVDSVREEMERLGWSVIVVGDSSAIKVHVHVDNPALPLDYAVKAGAALTDVVIENMQLQAVDFAMRQEQLAYDIGVPAISVIAVVEGEGMQGIFRDLNCASIIAGGAGENPSTEDFVGAIERAQAQSIIILPNHKDVVQAAEQAAKLQTDKRVRVVPTRTMLQGISAMVAFGDASDKNLGFDAMVAVMEAACASVTTIQITRATRSARLNGLDIRRNDFIALIDGEIRVVGTDIDSALRDSLLLTGINDKELVTLYCGADFDITSASELIESLLMTIKGIEFEVVYGGQALYPLLVSIE